MAYQHGIRSKQVETSIQTPVTATSGVPFVVGIAPVQATGGAVNEPILCNSFAGASKLLGYSDKWDKYSLCEVMYSQFRLYGVAPVVFVNVLDKAKHKKTIQAKPYPVTDRRVLLPFEAIKETVTVNSYNAGTDYELIYDEENLVVELLEDGNIPKETGELTIDFDEVAPELVTEMDIIGGFDVSTNKHKGLELIDKVFAKYGIVADLILAPGWSNKSTVAAVMATKCENINGIFEAKALIDLDTTETKVYSDVPAKKKKDNIFSKYQITCWPKVKLGEKVFNLSTHLAGVMGKTDTENDACPSESPSNKSLKIDAVVLADKTELLLDLREANFLNSNGVVTALNFVGGYVLWGNETACFPANTDIKDYFISVGRMFGWVANSVILTYWKKLDKNITSRFVDSIVDSINIWLNGLVAEGKILGGRVEFKSEDNNLAALMSGKAVFHIYLTPASPAKEVVFLLEYDPSYVLAQFAA